MRGVRSTICVGYATYAAIGFRITFGRRRFAAVRILLTTLFAYLVAADEFLIADVWLGAVGVDLTTTELLTGFADTLGSVDSIFALRCG